MMKCYLISSLNDVYGRAMCRFEGSVFCRERKRIVEGGRTIVKWGEAGGHGVIMATVWSSFKSLFQQLCRDITFIWSCYNLQGSVKTLGLCILLGKAHFQSHEFFVHFWECLLASKYFNQADTCVFTFEKPELLFYFYIFLIKHGKRKSLFLCFRFFL